jgi:hypothetical protein
MKINIEGNLITTTADSDLHVVISGARGPQGEPSPLGVPYTGATQDVDLGEFGLQTGNIEFDNTPTNTPTTDGSLYWDDTSGTLALRLKGGNVISKIGETQHIRAYNDTGNPIAKGKVVYVTGAQGQRLTIDLADADTELLSKDTIGITAEAIADGAEGFVIVAGILTNINTNGLADGDTVYLSQTAGSYTNVAPADPAHLVILGFVVNGGSGGAGSIYVKVDNGYELEELHNVSNSAKTSIVDADAVLLRDSADNNLWKRLTWSNLKAAVKTYLDTFKGVAGGYASLDGSGKVPSSELPSYVDDVIEVADYASLPATGETGKIYITLDNNKVYRWSGSVYVEIASGGGGTWGTITGTLSDQTDLQNALNAKQDTLTNPVTGTGASGQVSYWTGTNTQAGSNNLFWDAANNRLGVGTNAPTKLVSVNGEIEATVVRGATVYFRATTDTNFYIKYDGGDYLTYRSYNYHRWQTYAGSYDNRMYLYGNGNLLIQNGGTFTDNGQRLQVYGSTLLRGSGTTSATTALLVQNSTPSRLFEVKDDGALLIGSSANQAPFIAGATGTTLFGVSQRALAFVYNGGTNNRPNPAFWFTASTDINWTSNIGEIFITQVNFNPTSGTGVMNTFVVTPTINQTGGANGITRGLFVNPTLTSAADWRSIETSNNTGWSIYSAGTANSYFRGNVGIGTTNVSFHNLSVIGAYGASITTNVSSTPLTINAQGSFTGVFEMQNLNIRRLRILTTATSTTFESSNQTGGFVFGKNVLITGSGTTSATTALLVQNSTPTANFTIRDDGAYAFRGGTVGVAQTGYTTFTNLTTDRTCDANATTVEELADILGTLIEDLKTKGIIAA